MLKQDVVDSAEGTVGSFEMWPCLRVLDVSWMVLRGRALDVQVAVGKSLPVGLQTLRVWTDGYWSADAVVAEMVQLVRSGEAPGLRRVGVGSVAPVESPALAEACAGVGVELVEWLVSPRGWLGDYVL